MGRPPAGAPEFVVAVDALVEGTHFLPDAEPESVGFKALAVNLSDLAAMAADPVDAHAVIWCPARRAGWAARAREGLDGLASECGTRIARFEVRDGGADRVALCVQVAGQVPAGTALRRDGARPGEDLWISGEPGLAGLALERDASLPPAIAAAARERLDRPWPRLALGRLLRGLASAAIDVSDGLAQDAGHIAHRSGVGLEIDAARVPVATLRAAGLDRRVAVGLALAAGDDYELCFTAPRERRGKIAALAAAAGCALTRVGHATTGEGIVVTDGEHGRWPAIPGYRHFTGANAVR